MKTLIILHISYILILLSFSFGAIEDINYRIQIYSYGQHIETYFSDKLPEIEYYLKFQDILKHNKKYVCIKDNSLIIVTMMLSNLTNNQK